MEEGMPLNRILKDIMIGKRKGKFLMHAYILK